MMSQKQVLDVTTPAYLDKFTCLGPSCPDNCCYGWTVTVDHETYGRLRGLPDKQLKPVIQHALHRGKGKSGSWDYGYLSQKQDASRSCELLDGDGLCCLQKKCGEQILPDICSSFPRVTNVIDGQVEQFATMACPEVTRLIFSEHAPFDLVVKKREVRTGTVSRQADMKKNGPLSKLRAFLLALLATQEIPTWKSLVATQLIVEDWLAHSDQKQNIDELIEPFLRGWEEQILDGSLLQELDGLRRHDLLHVKVMAAASRIRSEIIFRDIRYLQLIEEALVGLSLGMEGADDQVLAANFAKAKEVVEVDALLRRVSLNHMVSNYFQSARDLVGDAQRLSMEYLMLRFWLVGLSLARKRMLRQEEVVELVYLFYRVNIHTPSYLVKCSQHFSAAGMNKVEHWMLILPLDAA